MNLVDLLLLCVSVTLKHVLFKFCTQGQMIQLLVFLFLLVKKKVLVAIRVTKSIACLKSTSCQVTFLSYKHLYGHMPSSCQHYNNTNINAELLFSTAFFAGLFQRASHLWLSMKGRPNILHCILKLLLLLLQIKGIIIYTVAKLTQIKSLAKYKVTLFLFYCFSF